MQSTPNLASEGNSQFKASYVFNVVVAYEDFVSGKRAKDTCDTIIRDLGPNYTFHFDLWKFDVLDVPQLRDIAANDAVDADMVIIAAEGRDELPQALKDWTQNWSHRKTRGESALVAMLDRCPEGSEELSPILSYLKEVAVRSGIDFFWEMSEESPVEDVYETSDRFMARAETVSSVVEGLFNQRISTSHWGLNE